MSLVFCIPGRGCMTSFTVWDIHAFALAHNTKKLIRSYRLNLNKLHRDAGYSPMPPYSPELNPVENLWHYLRSHYRANRIYADYDALCSAAIDAWHKAALNPAIIQSVCCAPYAERID